MKERDTRFPEYGGAGDTVGARRIRHAFRYCVIACVLFTGVLWLANGYSAPKPERLYRMAILHEDDSARAILRNLVPKSGEIPQDPRYARYLAALAFIEDGSWERARQGIYEEFPIDPLVLERYGQAVAAGGEDPYILNLYGCALFTDRQYARARDMFRDARRYSQSDDALPAYLEVAARMMAGEREEALRLLQETNSNPQLRIFFPEPLWHPSIPAHGEWHSRMRRRVADRLLGPLKELEAQVRAGAAGSRAGAVDAQAPDQPATDWNAWLREIELLGARLTGDDATPDFSLGTVQAAAGLAFMKDALKQRIQRGDAPAAEMADRLDAIQKAQARLDEFDAKERPAKIAAHRVVVSRPMDLALTTFLLLLAFYAVSYLLAKIFRAGRVSWSLPHPVWLQLVLALLQAALFGLLCIFTVMQRYVMAPNLPLELLTYAWYAVVALLALFGLVYPAILLPSAHDAARAHMPEGPDPELVRDARRARRTAFISLLRRYYGMAGGAFTIVLCAWFIVFTTFHGAYPFQPYKVVLTGLEKEEAAAVREARQMLP